MKHEDIRFKTRRTKATEIMEQDNGEIGKNQTIQIQKIYQITFDLSCIYSTRRNSRNYQKDVNGTMRSILWKKYLGS